MRPRVILPARHRAAGGPPKSRTARRSTRKAGVMTRTAVDDGDAISRHARTKPARPRTARGLPSWAGLGPLLRPRPVQLDPTQRRLSRALTIADLRAAAKRRTPPAAFAYPRGGGGGE